MPVLKPAPETVPERKPGFDHDLNVNVQSLCLHLPWLWFVFALCLILKAQSRRHVIGQTLMLIMLIGDVCVGRGVFCLPPCGPFEGIPFLNPRQGHNSFFLSAFRASVIWQGTPTEAQLLGRAQIYQTSAEKLPQGSFPAAVALLLSGRRPLQ